VDQRGRSVRLASLLGAEQPLMLNFIFTSCTTICPVSLATFGAVREQLGSEAGGVRFVSISIDPEHDTPARLLEYAHRQGVGDSWHFLTGDSWSVRRVQEAFGAYRGDKASHAPLILLRASPEKPWLRIEGFPSASDLVREYRRLVGE
jgi:protein SCO1/2